MKSPVFVSKIVFVVSIFVGWLFALPHIVYAQIYISEVMPDTRTEGDRSEWLELHNYGLHTVNLSHLTLNGKPVSYETQQHLLGANGYLVLTRDKAAFAAEFGSTPLILELDISLANSGGALELKQQDKVLDQLNFGSAKQDASWQRRGPLCPQELSWLEPTPGKQNKQSLDECFPPKPHVIEGKVEVSIDGQQWQANVNQVGAHQLFWRLDSSVPASHKNKGQWLDGFGNLISSPWQFPVLVNQRIQYLVEDDTGLTVYRSQPLTIIPQLQLTEIYPDPGGDDAGKEWIEIFNPATQTANLELQILINQQQLELDVTLAAQGYTQVILPTAILPNCVETNCQGQVRIKVADHVLDEFVYKDSLPEQSWTKFGSTWALSTLPSPGKANLQQQILKTVEISEVYPSPQSGEEEWLELYNYGDIEVDLAGWQVKDMGGKHSLSGKVGAKEYLKVEKLKITLNNTGEQLELFAADQTLVDKFVYPATAKGNVAIRLLASSSNRHQPQVLVSDQPTPGKENEASAVNNDSNNSAGEVLAVTSVQSGSTAPVATASKYIYALPDLEVVDLTGSDAKDGADFTSEILSLLLAVGGFGVLSLLGQRYFKRDLLYIVQRLHTRSH